MSFLLLLQFQPKCSKSFEIVWRVSLLDMSPWKSIMRLVNLQWHSDALSHQNDCNWCFWQLCACIVTRDQSVKSRQVLVCFLIVWCFLCLLFECFGCFVRLCQMSQCSNLCGCKVSMFEDLKVLWLDFKWQSVLVCFGHCFQLDSLLQTPEEMALKCALTWTLSLFACFSCWLGFRCRWNCGCPSVDRTCSVSKHAKKFSDSIDGTWSSCTGGVSSWVV